MLKKLFLKQQNALTFFYSQLDMGACEQFVHAILRCTGTLVFTGVGKSGFIAQKIAATMMSTGTRAVFLPPIDALHGDLGMLSSEDLVVIFSKSGETEEILELLPFIRDREATVGAITSNCYSRLAKSADLTVTLPCSSELCPFDLAPTISTEVQLLFGDVMSIAVMEAKGFSLDQYAANHPGGRIGRRASVKVHEMMLGEERVPLCSIDNRLEEVLVDFSNKRCGCLIVVDTQKQLKGIFTDGDLRRALQSKGERVLQEKIGDLMTPFPKFIHADDPAWEALQLMESDQKYPITVLPVLDNREDEVVGIIKMHDLIQAGL